MDLVPCCGLLRRKQKIQSGQTKSDLGPPKKVAFWKGKKPENFRDFPGW